MKTQVSETSLLSYQELLDSGKLSKQQSVIMANLNLYKHTNLRMTSREIAEITGIERSAVTGRLNTLVKLGVVDEYGKVQCPITKRWVKAYRIAKGK